MKHKDRIALPAIGGSSLLVIFAVLCLTVFSLLSLTTALAERRSAEAAADAVAAYYQADLQAQACFAGLRAGEMVPGVTVSGDRYRFDCPISDTQTLEVELLKTEESWTILRWQTVACPAESSQTLPVWNGQ